MAAVFACGLAWSALPPATVAQVPNNLPPGAPTLISPPDGYRFAHGEPQRFAVLASDPGLEPYQATVTVLDEDQEEVFVGDTHYAPSGVQANTVAVPPLLPGRYTWSARATDIQGATGSASVMRTLEVGPRVTGGAGAFAGALDFSPTGLRRLGCAPTQFQVVADAEAVAVNAAVFGFVGKFRLTGSGAGGCEDATLGLGTMTLSAQGTGPTASEISCPEVTGDYTRAGTTLLATLTGDCAINNFPTGELTWLLVAHTPPTETGTGLTSPIVKTRFDGTLTLRSLLLTEGESQL